MITFEPCALNVEFQHFILIFNKIPLLWAGEGRGGGNDSHENAGLEFCTLCWGTTEEQETMTLYNVVEPLSMLEIRIKADEHTLVM